MLALDLDQQDRVFADAFSILQQGVNEHGFPCAATAVTIGDRLVVLRAFGRFTYEPSSPAAAPDTVFDIASLTKAVATTTMAMILYERGQLDLDLRVAGALPEFRTAEWHRDEVTVRMLLAHTSGLPAYARLFESCATRDELILAAARCVLTAPPGARVEYSDIGFIVLGVLLERLAGETLDSFSFREIFGPLGLVRSSFVPPAFWRAAIPPTENDHTFRHRIIQGEVNDENASVMGGVAGHAGMFSTAGDLATFAACLLGGGSPLVRPDTLKLFAGARFGKPGEAQRALGWDVPTPPSQSGQHFSSSAYGHLGFTGTSLWLDPERNVSVTLLTNRTWPDRQNQSIKSIRPRFHDAVMEAILSSR